MTNGFDEARVYDAIKVRMGFRQPTDPDFKFALTTANKDSATGRFYDDFHPLVSAAKLYDTQDNAQISEADFNTYLSNLEKSVITATLNAVFSEPQLVESSLLFEPTDNTEPNKVTGSKFVGYRINLAEGYALNINSAAFTFDSQVTFNLYLFHSRKKQPLQTKSVTTNENEAAIVSLNWVLSESESTKGGTFYIGYFLSDIGEAKALDYQECIKCFKSFGVYGVEMEGDSEAVTVDGTNYSFNSGNYGLNLDISAYRDYTKKIISNVHVFDELLGLNMAAIVLDILLNSHRINDTKLKLSDTQLQSLMADLNMGEQTDMTPRVPGIKNRLKSAIKAAVKTFFPKDAITITCATI